MRLRPSDSLRIPRCAIRRRVRAGTSSMHVLRVRGRSRDVQVGGNVTHHVAEVVDFRQVSAMEVFATSGLHA